MATLDQIVAYIRQYAAKYPLAALRGQLLKQGLPQDLVDQAIQVASGGKGQDASSTHAAPPDAKPKPQPKPAVPIGYVTPKAPPVPPPLGRSFILVVDDDQLIRDMLVSKLEGVGYRVTCAEDAAQSVIQAEGMRLSLIISDIEMPGFGTGVDALKKLRASNFIKRNLPVIFVTGMPPQEAKRIVPMTDPYVRLMHKPVDWNLLRMYIRDLTGMDKVL